MRENKALKVIICIIALVFIVHQAYSSFYKPITTVSAEYCTDIDGVDITGIIVREEKVVASDVAGTLHFVLSDGERVSKNGVIANIYANADASVTVNRIEQLNSRISDIEEMQSYNDVEAADISLANAKVTNSLNGLIRECATGNYSSIDDCADELLTNINRRQMITGEQTDFSARLAELKSERDSLNATLPQAVGYITADTAGYFVSGIDGYESVLSCDNIDNITPEFLDSLKPEKINENAVGKIVSGYTWYIVAKISTQDSLQYKMGDTFTVKTSVKSNPVLDVTVEKINTSSNSETAVLVLSCQQMSGELAAMRKGSMTIVKNTYSGLKLSKKALRVQDGKTGVFVRSGSMLKFVTVNVIQSTDEYIICEQQTSNDSVLRLYDDVVVKGKRLYDGKIVD